MLVYSFVVLGLVALASAQHLSQRLVGVTIKDLQEKASVQFSAYDRSFSLTLGKLEQSIGGSSTYRVGTDAGAEYSQVTLSFFAGPSGSRLFGVIELEGGSEKHRTYDLETDAAGDLVLHERVKVQVLAAETPSAPSSGDHGHGNHPVDYIRADVTIPPSASRKRARRSGPASSSHTACGVFLDIDSTFYTQWGVGSTEAERIQTAINKAASYMQSAATLYQSSFGSSIVLEIAGAAVFTTGNLGAGASVTSAGDYLSAYSVFLGTGATSNGVAAKVRGASLPTSQEVCLNVALTHRNFGSVVGMAYVGSPDDDTVGGVCSDWIQTNPPQAFNTGMVDSWGSRDITIMSRGIAHEIGHAFGADHACCSGASVATGCSETDSCANPYLMYYMLSYGTNGGAFSTGARAEINNVLASKGNCLRVPRTQAAVSTAQSSIVTTITLAPTTTTRAVTTRPTTTRPTTTVKTTTTTTRKTTTTRRKNFRG